MHSGTKNFAMAGFLAAAISVSLQAQAQTPAPAVLVQTAEMKVIAKTHEFIGRVEAIEKVDLRARVEGFLGARLFQDGDMVTKGQLLFQIEREPFEAVLDQRKALLGAAEATRDNADFQYQRGKELSRTNNIAQAQLDQRAADLARAKADVLGAEAAVREAQIQLSYTDIKSPMAGRIGRATVSPGNLIGPQTGIIATVVQETPVNVLFQITQRELLEARQKMGGADKLVVKLRLADGSFYAEPGKVNFVDVQADSRTDSQTVRAVFANPGTLLSPGQTVRVNVDETKTEQTVVIPQAAITIDQTGPYVFVVNKANVVEQRRVSLGTGNDGMVSVLSGVAAGDSVIVQGAQRVRPGMTVSPQTAPTVRG